jgi:hypothetical protein
LLLSSRHPRHYFENVLTYSVRSSVFFISPERTKSSRSTTRKSLPDGYRFRCKTAKQRLVTRNVFSGKTGRKSSLETTFRLFSLPYGSQEYKHTRLLQRKPFVQAAERLSTKGMASSVPHRFSTSGLCPVPLAVQPEPTSRPLRLNGPATIVRGAGLPDRCAGRVSLGRRPRGLR